MISQLLFFQFDLCLLTMLNKYYQVFTYRWSVIPVVLVFSLWERDKYTSHHVKCLIIASNQSNHVQTNKMKCKHQLQNFFTHKCQLKVILLMVARTLAPSQNIKSGISHCLLHLFFYSKVWKKSIDLSFEVMVLIENTMLYMFFWKLFLWILILFSILGKIFVQSMFEISVPRLKKSTSRSTKKSKITK